MYIIAIIVFVCVCIWIEHTIVEEIDENNRRRNMELENNIRMYIDTAVYNMKD